MQRSSHCAVVAGLLLLVCGQSVIALEADELLEQAKAIRKKAAAMSEQAKEATARMLETAERMELQAKGVGETGEHERSPLETKARQLKERLQDLTAKERQLREANANDQQLAEVRAQISEVEQTLRRIDAKHLNQANHRDKPELHHEFRPHAEKIEAASRRIHHIRVAAENLKHAEIHDLAHQLMEKAESMQEDVQRAKQRLVEEMRKANSPPNEHGPDSIQELRNENERLKQMIKELTRKIESR